jgi:uncharacterized protein (TIGR02596 family)
MRHSATLRGFSLVELLVVVALLAMLMTMLVPAVGSMNTARLLTAAGSSLEGGLTLARENALVRRAPVEVRLYSYAVPGSTAAYRAMQAFIMNDQGEYSTPVGKMIPLPTGIIISSNAAYSTLMADASGSATFTNADPIPRIGTYTARAFRFLPNGQTTLSNSTPFPFLTLHSERLSNPASGNFYTIQIDPLNGKLRNYRP